MRTNMSNIYAGTLIPPARGELRVATPGDLLRRAATLLGETLAVAIDTLFTWIERSRQRTVLGTLDDRLEWG